MESMAPKPKGKNCGFSGPWAVVGDFNLIYQDQDKNNTNLNRRMMGRFRRVINDLALHELHLKPTAGRTSFMIELVVTYNFVQIICTLI